MEFNAREVVVDSELEDFEPSKLLNELIVSNPKAVRRFTHFKQFFVVFVKIKLPFTIFDECR